MASKIQRPLFIFGCPRSGTSLLSRMLNQHPNIAIPYESHLYNWVYPLLRRSGALFDPRARPWIVAQILRTDYMRDWVPRPSLTDTVAAITRDDFHGIVEGLMRAWTAGQGKSRWGEKTPQHTLCWRTIREGFPDLQVLHLTRDGRDVALSYRAAHFGPKHVYELARRWVQYLSAAEAAEAALGQGAFLTVRYESLVDQPEGELQRICAFLGEEYTPDMLTFYSRGGDYPTDRRNLDNLRRPVLTGNSGKWRSQMTAREVRIFEAIAGDYLERYGYGRSLRNPRISAWEAFSCRYLEHPPLRAIAMLHNRQGHRLAMQELLLRLRLRMGI